MRKQGEVITYLPFKKYLILILIIVGLYFLYYLIILKSAGIITLPKSCPEGIIPERTNIDLIPDGARCITKVNEWGNRIGNCLNTWKDGTRIGNYMICRKGSKEGENINYLYCENLVYENQPISSSGEIEKKISFKIDLVVNPSDKTKEGYKIIESKCRS